MSYAAITARSESITSAFPPFYDISDVKKEASGMCASGSRPPNTLFLPPDLEEKNAENEPSLKKITSSRGTGYPEWGGEVA